MCDVDEVNAADVERIRRLLRRVLDTPSVTHGLARTFRAALKEVDLYRSHRASQVQVRAALVGDGFLRVQVGGGGHRIDGFLNIDIMPPADLVWDVREGLPLGDESAEFVFSEHFLEHIDYPRSAKHYVAETRRVLRPGGHVVTGVPDAGAVLVGYLTRDRRLFDDMLDRWYANRDCRDSFNTYIDLVNYVFRDQDDDPKYNPHHWAYDYDKLVQLFAEAGFEQVQPWEFDPHIANAKRRWGSLYVIATK